MKKLLLGGAALLALAAAIPAMAADMPVKAPILKAPVELPYNWTGFYIGGNVGYSWGRGETDLLDASTSTVSEFRGVPPLTLCPSPTACPALPAGFGAATAGAASGTANMNGFLGGAQAGYNAQYNTFVLGAEVDIQATGQRGSVTLFDPTNIVLASVNDKMPWFATFRGRIGVLPAPRWLLYVTGGGALTEIDQDIAVGAGTLAAVSSTNTTRFGWVIGGGVEAAIERSNWTVKAEFLHMDFGSISSVMAVGSSTTTLSNFPSQGFSTVVTSSTAAALNTRVTDNVFRVGANYRIAPR